MAGSVFKHFNKGDHGHILKYDSVGQKTADKIVGILKKHNIDHKDAKATENFLKNTFIGSFCFLFLSIAIIYYFILKIKIINKIIQ